MLCKLLSTLNSKSLPILLVGTSAYIKQDDGIEDDLSANNDQLIEMGVALNKAYQEIVSESLEMIQLLLAQNHEKQVCENFDWFSERWLLFVSPQVILVTTFYLLKNSSFCCLHSSVSGG